MTSESPKRRFQPTPPLGPLFRPSPAQQAFADGFLADSVQRTRLAAGPGSGKTTLASHVADETLRRKLVHGVIFPTSVGVAQWSEVTKALGLPTTLSIDDALMDGPANLIASPRALEREASLNKVLTAAAAPTLIVHDDSERSSPELNQAINRLLGINPRSRYLALFTPDQERESLFGSPFDSEYFLDRSLVLIPTRAELARYSPSHSLLRDVLRQHKSFDDLSWREFERLVSELLEANGYTVELMSGTKDGGVDVVAVKDHGPDGLFKTLWQAKKKDKGKVGLDVVRELADTRTELKASKAIIVTSSYLTRGALERVERDRFVLGKTDRDDLSAWIRRVALGKHGPHSR